MTQLPTNVRTPKGTVMIITDQLPAADRPMR